jgi:pimeloyl-ACP methyl ester carboxylesterase
MRRRSRRRRASFGPEGSGNQSRVREAEVPLRHRHVEVAGSRLHVLETGDADGQPYLFLHGWPGSARSWEPLMARAARDVRAIAVDLPGVGGSSGEPTDGSKRDVARVIHALIGAMGLTDVTLVGHDVGGMVAYAYLRQFSDIAAAVIMDVVIPGLDPWDSVIRNPYIWHFAMHAIPELPETLVDGRQGEYFAYFYEALSFDATKITPEARLAAAQAYGTRAALTAGFNWYRTFPTDAAANEEDREDRPTPVLYLRGDHEGGEIADYVRGLRSGGLTSVEHALVPNAGHFAPQEAPDHSWEMIHTFAGRS